MGDKKEEKKEKKKGGRRSQNKWAGTGKSRFVGTRVSRSLSSGHRAHNSDPTKQKQTEQKQTDELPKPQEARQQKPSANSQRVRGGRRSQNKWAGTGKSRF